MRPPDPSKPVLHEGTRNLYRYRYGVPLLVIAITIFVGWSMPAQLRGRLSYFLLPAVVVLGWAVVYGQRLRSASITEEGIILKGEGPPFLLEWSDIDWATEIWMNPPTLVLRRMPEIPAIPQWFLIIPPRERRFGWTPQPMSLFVAERVREARAAHPESALTHGDWPSRAALTLKVQGGITLAILGTLAFSLWLASRDMREGPKQEQDPDAPVSASATPPRVDTSAPEPLEFARLT